jgi:hypothetical protein
MTQPELPVSGHSGARPGSSLVITKKSDFVRLFVFTKLAGDAARFALTSNTGDLNVDLRSPFPLKLTAFPLKFTADFPPGRGENNQASPRC